MGTLSTAWLAHASFVSRICFPLFFLCCQNQRNLFKRETEICFLKLPRDGIGCSGQPLLERVLIWSSDVRHGLRWNKHSCVSQEHSKN